jgi:hypothetical protein
MGIRAFLLAQLKDYCYSQEVKPICFMRLTLSHPEKQLRKLVSLRSITFSTYNFTDTGF